MNSFPFVKVGKEDYTRFVPGEQKMFNRLRKKKGSNWKYYNEEDNPIIYDINHLGYRTKSEIPQTEYFLALGCSNTFGLYLHEEERYSNIIETKTGIPTLNLGISGGSANIIHMNLLKLLFSECRKPSAVFIQWPVYMRMNFPFTEPYSNIKRVRTGNNRRTEQIFIEMVKDSNLIETASLFSYENTCSILNYFNIKLINFSVAKEDADFFGVELIERVDKARDDKHCGTDTNKKIAEYVLQQI